MAGLSYFCSLFLCITLVCCFPEQGKWNYEFPLINGYESIVISKSLSVGGKFLVKITCESSTNEEQLLDIMWYIRKLSCWKYYSLSGPKTLMPEDIYLNLQNYEVQISNSSSEYVGAKQQHSCDSKGFYLVSEGKKFHLKGDSETEAMTQKDVGKNNVENGISTKIGDSSPLFTVKADGIYQLILGIKNHVISSKNDTLIKVHVEIYGTHGYLSAADYPLLIFYSTMCVIYVLYGIGWLVVSFMQWRELLRVQYWIGAVIFLGMLEKAVFTAEYESVNETGISYAGLIVFAELVSCAKRTLSRMLVIIVSFGFGIVKPRLGVVLHRVVTVGLLYFILASIEGCLRALKPNFPNGADYRMQFFATIPLAMLESAICWWIFSALVTTTRTLRLRRNTTKLSLYRHFTCMLVFAVVTSVIFMLWSIKYLNMDECVKDWKQLWVNDAFWHVLFALMLFVIMILWRPTNNNQRFAYSPLLDGIEGDDEEEDRLMADVSDTMKLRGSRNSASSSPRESRSVEEDLKWLEENIPSTLADTALPVMDSEEEIMNTKFEISKMQ